MNETMVTVVGNVISEVSSRHTPEGIAVASFRMACNERRFVKASGQWVDGDRLYLSVTCWRKLAMGVRSSLHKGDPVLVRGRLYTRGYEVDGARRSATEIEAYQLGLDLSRCQVEVQRTDRPARQFGDDAVAAVPEPTRAATAADALAGGSPDGNDTRSDGSGLVAAGAHADS
jgi:single-strand DNA-binding protein